MRHSTCLIRVCLRFEHGEHRVGEDDAVQDRIVFYGKQFLCQRIGSLYRQILIPVLAVGLCYGIETDVVQMVAQYIIRLLTARGELDSVLRAAFCHHPENYISLMEYYTPEEHGMEPFTRK